MGRRTGRSTTSATRPTSQRGRPTGAETQAETETEGPRPRGRGAEAEAETGAEAEADAFARSTNFHALENALEVIRSLRGPMVRIRRRSSRMAEQIERAASSVAANVAEGNRRQGKDRLHHFRIAAGSADETRTHLRVAEAWGYVTMAEVQRSLELIDRELAMLWCLTRSG